MRNTLRSVITATALTWALSLSPGLAAAGDQGGPGGDGPGPCREDAQRLCADSRGGKEVFGCLKAHESEISDACRERIAQRKQQFEARVQSTEDACRSDIASHCGKVEQGGGRVLQCLRQHESELSEECRAKLPAARGKGRRPAAPPPKAAQP